MHGLRPSITHLSRLKTTNEGDHFGTKAIVPSRPTKPYLRSLARKRIPA